ncbi:ABC-type antimicrobial peptide transport system, ATPase component [Hahella chejuensis KCTC 2396]|uniref:ABC-type antimicrobial peptide transport system, ATPase component n=1 Tax=Hahella chejuensis (strain KCTC 2396) TaxID=349521 RepID=Q2SMJ2_HAHCH|nr:ABC transporter ATP-binding protein [Hahella chejuensis]ABC28132.1 ABC-type antimicrobial peptide transport system, ATPase component [Hahella chejuensis KCTC 2396]
MSAAKHPSTPPLQSKPAAPVVALHEVNRHFQLGEQTVKALDAVSLQLLAGEYVSVMGPSGSGKSTLLNILGLLDRPDAGAYLLNGDPTQDLSEEKRARLRQQNIGFVFQSYHLIPRMSARENIELPLVLAGAAPKERARMVSDMLERLGLTDRASHLPNQLSGGQRQRVAIGRAIIMKPKLLLADEPTGNLDTQSGADVVTLLEELNAQGITLVVVTHDVELGKRARRQLRMVDGRIQSDVRQRNVSD